MYLNPILPCEEAHTFLTLFMKVKVKSLSHVWLLAIPWTVALLQARILEWVAIPFSRDLPDPGIEPRSPALQEILYYLNHQGTLQLEDITWERDAQAWPDISQGKLVYSRFHCSSSHLKPFPNVVLIYSHQASWVFLSHSRTNCGFQLSDTL